MLLPLKGGNYYRYIEPFRGKKNFYKLQDKQKNLSTLKIELEF